MNLMTSLEGSLLVSQNREHGKWQQFCTISTEIILDCDRQKLEN
jgi:hypothetical protein